MADNVTDDLAPAGTSVRPLPPRLLGMSRHPVTRTEEPAGTRVFRTLPARVFGWSLVVVTVALAVMLVRSEQERELDILTPVAVTGFVVAVVWVGLLRPCVVLRPDGVVLRNLLTDTTVPFSRLQEVGRDWSLELVDGTGRKHSAWAVPVRRDFRPRGNIDRYAEATTRGKAREGVHADVVAGHVEHRWQRWKLEGGQVEPGQPATKVWATGALVPLLGAAVLVVAAFVIS
jgi:hypothetical protein